MKSSWIAIAGVALMAAGPAEAGVRVVRVSHPSRHHAITAVAHHPHHSRVLVVTPLTRGHGALDVSVDGRSARVFVDGEYLGRGDRRTTLRAGTHTVRVQWSDGRQVTKRVAINGGRTTAVRIER